MSGRPVAIEERFHKHYIPEPNSGCWLWTAAVIKSRPSAEYGVIVSRGKNFLAHRISYELHKGMIPAKHHVDHTCENTYCVNPEHLEAVTPEEHARRTHDRKFGVNTCRRGHPFDEANTWVEKTGDRHCRTCHMFTQRNYMKRLRCEGMQ